MADGRWKSLDAKWVLRCLALALAYFIAARLALAWAIPPGYAAPLWPAAGIAAGALAVWGARLWPGVWFGAALANYLVGNSPLMAAWIASGNALEAACAVWLARRLVDPELKFRRPEAVVAFALVAGLAAMVAASLAVPGLFVREAIKGEQVLGTWFTWWLGDAAGILVFAPLVIAWARPEPEVGKRVRTEEAVVFALLFAATAFFVFWGPPEAIGRRPGAFIALVFVIWAGSRFGLRAITALAAGLVVIAAGATSIAHGPFALEDANESLLMLNAFAGATALAGLALHALRRQRDDPAIDRLRVSERQLAEAQRLAAIGSWYWKVKEDTVSWSHELYRLFGQQSGSPQTYEKYLSIVHPDDRDTVHGAVRGALESGKVFSHEYRIRLPSGEVRTMHARGFPEFGLRGEVIGLHGTCQDVSDQKAAREREKALEDRFRALVEHVREYAIFMLDPDGNVTSWNVGAERIKGYRAEEVLGKHVSCFYPPEYGRRHADEQLHAALRDGNVESEGWRVRKDGRRFWANVIITPMFDNSGGLSGYAKITRDLTERKQADEDLRSYASRLMSTSRRLLEVQEAERRRLATELHDRVGPNLTAMGIKLEMLEGEVAPDARGAAAELIEECKSLLQETVGATRSVMAELRPQVLADYGLAAALRATAAAFAQRTGIEATLEEAGAVPRLPQSVELAIYRIAQEALNNVGKHARAQRVRMKYSVQDGRVTLDVEDDGEGFAQGHLAHSDPNAGWGLIIMRERAEAAGARFALEARPGAGVRVSVSYRT